MSHVRGARLRVAEVGDPLRRFLTSAMLCDVDRLHLAHRTKRRQRVAPTGEAAGGWVVSDRSALRRGRRRGTVRCGWDGFLPSRPEHVATTFDRRHLPV